MSTLTKGPIGEQDLKRWDGTGSKTFSRETSSGGRVTLNKIGYEVDALISYGNGMNYTAACINAAIAAIGSVTTRLVLRPGTWDVNANVTFPANVTAVIPAGCILDADTGVTVTFNGPIEADAHDWQSGAGTFTIGSPSNLNIQNAPIQLKGDARLVRFNDTGSSGKEMAIRSDGGNLEVCENTGTEASPTWTPKLQIPAGAVQSILDAAGSMAYASAANVLAKLAIGSPGQMLVVNAAGTAPVWASPFKVGVLDPEPSLNQATADVAYTGVGFKPTAIAFLGWANTSACGGMLSIGFDDLTTSVVFLLTDTTPTYYGSASYSIYLFDETGKQVLGTVKSFDTDGFTISWLKQGSPANALAHVYYLAFR